MKCRLMSIMLVLSVFSITALAENHEEVTDKPYEPASVSLGPDRERDQMLSILVGVGYGFPIGGEELPWGGSYRIQTNLSTTFDSNQSLTYDENGTMIDRKKHYLNYGRGLKIALAADIGLLRNLGISLGGQWTQAVPAMVVHFEDQSPGGSTYNETYSVSMFGPRIMLRPRMHLTQKLKLVSAIGVGAYFTRLKIENDNTQYTTYEGYIETQPSIAFVGELGLRFPLSDRVFSTISVCCEQVSFRTSLMSPTTESQIYKSERDFVDSERESNWIDPIQIPGSNVALKALLEIKIL